MISPDDREASVPHVLCDAEGLTNTFGLPDTVEGKYPEHIVDKVEEALNREARVNVTAYSGTAGKTTFRICPDGGPQACAHARLVYNGTRL